MIRGALVTVVLLAGCSGSVGPSPHVVDPNKITVAPAEAVLYGGLATTLSITGGTGTYLVTSDNQGVIRSPSGTVGHSLTITPNPVQSDTAVRLTVRDTGSTPQQVATMTVRPGTVSNQITIAPATANCTPALCSGEEALLTATLSQGGVVLPARGARVEVVSGDVRLITTPVGASVEQLETSQTLISDETGRIRARLRALPLSQNQAALIQITDLGTMAFQRVAVPIAQFTGSSPAFFALPSSITFTGPFSGQCASSALTDVLIFGGAPPYSVSNTTSALFVSPNTIARSGGAFTVRLTGQFCISSAPIAITDSTGRTLAVSVSNIEGTATQPAAPISILPATLTLNCAPATSTLAILGGTEPFAAGSTHPRLTFTVTGRSVTVTRLGGDGAAVYPTAATISVTDGNSTGNAAATVPANCPP